MKKALLTICLLTLAMLSFAQWHINEGFESTALPTGWTVYDDGDGMTWRSLNNPTHAHTGNRAAFVDDYLPNVNSDWLITPAINIIPGDSLYFFTRAWISTENLHVYVSTTGIGIPNFNQQLVYLQNIGTTYQSVQLNLSAYAGQTIYLGFFWQCTNYGILMDDMKVGHPEIIQPVLNLPDSFTFIQGESLEVDFTPFINSTNINTAALSVSGNTHTTVNISNHQVTFSSPAWNGTENLTFTLTDNSSGLQTTDTVDIIVAPVPTVDLGLTQVTAPRELEFVSHSIYPSVWLVNLGNNVFDTPIEVNCTIRDAQNQITYNHDTVYNQSVAPDSMAQIAFAQNWVPSVIGSYTAQFILVTADENPVNNTINLPFTVVIREMTGGPDSFGYRWIDSNAEGGPAYVWNDISTTGQSAVMHNVAAFAGDDNFCEPIDFGFNFLFYGVSYSHFYVDINGELLLAENSWYNEYPDDGWDSDGNMFNYMYPIPGYTQMPGLIAAYWDDLQADQGTGDIYYQSFGTQPNRYFIIQWNNLRFHAGTGGSPVLKFQAVLHENGEIFFYYHTTMTGQTGSTVPHSNGRSATVALQNQAANIGLCYMREIVVNNTYQGVEPAGNLLHDGLAIRFYSGEDTQAPVITHIQPGNTFNQAPVLTAHIIDMSVLSTVVLHYNYSGEWQTLTPGNVANGDYNFSLPQLPLGATLQYYFTASDEHDNSAELPVNAPEEVFSFKILPTDAANVLVVYSGHQDYQHLELPVYEALLDAQGVNYDIYDWEEYPAYSFPTSYAAILCYANNGISGDVSDVLSIALMNYLESGTTDAPRHLFFASDGWAYGQSGSPNSSPEKKLLEAYFRTTYVPQGGGGGTNGLSGPDHLGYDSGTLLITNTSPVGTPGNLFDVYANSPDCIFSYDSCPDWYADEVQFPETGAQNALAFEDGPIDGQAYLYHGVCATTVDLGIYKSFYFSFDLSQLSDDAQRTVFMHDLLDWFGVLTTGNDDNAQPAPIVGMLQNYPNPFNPQTTISFQVRAASITKLEIFNSKGQLVKTLFKGSLLPGRHNLTWNGLDDNDHTAASGVYYCRLTNDNVTKTHKLLLMK